MNKRKQDLFFTLQNIFGEQKFKNMLHSLPLSAIIEAACKQCFMQNRNDYFAKNLREIVEYMDNGGFLS